MQGWKTFLGIFAAAVGALLVQLGYDPAAVADATQEAEGLGAQLLDIVEQLLLWGGLVLAAWGRLVAKVKVLGGGEMN